MRTPATIYIIAATLAAFLLTVFTVGSSLDALASQDWLGWFVFLVLGAASEGLAVGISVGNRGAKASMLFLPLFALAVSFSPAALILAAIAVQLFSEMVLAKPILWRVAFNVSQIVLSFGIAAHIYHFAAGNFIGSTYDFVAFTIMAASYFTLNVVLVVGFFSVRQRASFRQLLIGAIGPLGANLLWDLLASPIALVCAILYAELHVPGVLLIILPLYLIRYSYLSKVQLQQANNDLLKVLIKAIETRDPYTSGHSVRVSTLAKAIAEDMGLPTRLVATVEKAALLHDIGKIDPVYVPLIQKPYDLTDEERELIRTHAARGADLLESLSSVESRVVAAVRFHHERFDGKGYPSGIAGMDIPTPARIIMVSDSIDAMLSDRPYRAALTIEKTESELLRCSGTQFDPEIVQAILRCKTLERARALVEHSQAEDPLHI